MAYILYLQYILILVLAVWLNTGKKTDHVELRGSCNQHFHEVKKKFSAMIQNDRDGAALTVLLNGKMVVNLYGGYSDRSAEKVWNSDTMTLAYSSTKIWAGLVAAILASQGHLNYDRRITSFWPEFGKNSKEDLTIRDVLDHRAGLITFGREFSLEEAYNSEKISKLIEEAKPHWQPGTRTGYHALTYGFLIDEIIRRIDPKHRSISQIYHEEIRDKDVDFFIGIGKEDHHRVARITNPTFAQSILAHAKRPVRFYEILLGYMKYDQMADVSANYPYFISVMRTDTLPYNNPDVRALPLVSCMGVGSAKGFAEAIHLLNKKQLVSERVWQLIREPTSTEEDIVMYMNKSLGHGFTYVTHPVKKKEWNIRFIGNGLQVVEYNHKDGVIIVMLRNGLRAGDDGMEEYEDISRTVFEIINGNSF